jgi:hypothetical protein
MPRPGTTSALLLLVACLAPAQADEGMWTFDNVPLDRIEKSYGFRPSQRWLDRVRLSSLRLADGCSAAFVSARGLVQTNYHCMRSCIQDLSTGDDDLNANGFYARTLKDERKCPDVEASQLTAISDVTARVRKATAGLDREAFADALNAEKAAIERECSGDDDNIRCDVVELYMGGLYHLYRYRRYQDLRLVFAPEDAIAFFGGDADNFEFPRFNLDVTYLRVYRDGRPLDTRAHYLPYAKSDAGPGDLTFTAGHPATSSRLETAADLEFRRDVMLPEDIAMNEGLREVLAAFSAEGVEQARIAKDILQETENTLKGDKGRLAALVDPEILGAKAAFERNLQARVAADPELQQYAPIWDNVRAVRAYYRSIRSRYVYTDYMHGFRSRLFGFAKTLVRYAAESSKPDEERLPEFTEAGFPELRQSLLSTAPVYLELDKVTLAFSLAKLRDTLGPSDKLVAKVLAGRSPTERAAELVDGTQLANVELRTRLLEGGQAAIDASTDPMIVLVRQIDPELRAIRKDYVSNVDAPLIKAYGQLAQLMFKLHGTSIYPDATQTLRLSYGAVAGYRQDGRTVPPMTTIAGLFKRATGVEPYSLPASWVAARRRLNPRQPFNFVTTNDVVGGSSGSPVVNRAGEVVGLVFDGNIQSLGGDFGYDGATNRTISVNVGMLREALSKVYRAERLLRELKR